MTTKAISANAKQTTMQVQVKGRITINEKGLPACTCGDVVARLADEPPSSAGAYLYRCAGCGATAWIGI